MEDQQKKEIEKRLKVAMDMLKSEEQRASIPTKKVYKTLYLLGRELHFRPYGSKLKDLDVTSSEWLYDFSWRATDDKFFIDSLPLIVESEGGNQDAVLIDFLKLVQARADIRLMIYTARSEDVIPKAKEIIERFKNSLDGDFYLFAEWQKSKIIWHTYQYFS